MSLSQGKGGKLFPLTTMSLISALTIGAYIKPRIVGAYFLIALFPTNLKDYLNLLGIHEMKNYYSQS